MHVEGTENKGERVLSPELEFLTSPTASCEMRQALQTRKREYCAGTILKVEAEENTATYCVLSGWLALSKSTIDGERQIIDVILPGEILHPTSADGHSSWIQIETLSRASLAVVPRAEWSKLEATDPTIRKLEATTIAASMSRMSERMLRLGKGTAESRIAYALIELCLRLTAIRQSKNREYHLPMTQKDLGDFVGLSSVHVCRTLRRLNRNGVISTMDHMDIRIHDVETLAHIAEVDLDRLRSEIISVR
ncbi:Crp/Fnr family transcriptional regulator [Roseovarius sp. E0-M6]|uniref:Crp/Fnr family transcriptional regulator n=1 Tax=Roseovarius sp. E0-M6 TaxID=3127118 RepID=UPI00300FC819